MKIVNKYIINHYLDPLGGDRDELYDKFKNLGFDSNNQQMVKNVIIEYIKPYLETWPINFKTTAKNSLAYFLKKNNVDFEYIYNSALMPFDAPNEARDFFLWLWEVLYEDWNYKEINEYHFKESEDLEEPSRIWQAL